MRQEVTQIAAKFKKVSSGVFYSEQAVPEFNFNCIEFLKHEASQSPLKRARLCGHPSLDSEHHAMLIVLAMESIVAPHKHTRKSETMTVIEGVADALLFDEAGSVTQCIRMGPLKEGGSFSYYMPPGIYHTIIPRTPWYVFVETTPGPFSNDGLDEPAWSPNLNHPEERTQWKGRCEEAIASILGN